MIRRHLRLVPVSAVLLQSFLGCVLLTGGGCGGDTPAPEVQQQNIQDELNASEAAKKPSKAGQP